jgi:nitrogen fixation protein FixH
MKAWLVIITAIGLLAVAGAVIIGMKSFDGTVTDNAYEKGLAWDDMQRDKEELGWNAEINSQQLTTGNNELILMLTDKGNDPLLNAEVFLTISRPSSSEYDRELDTAKVRDGLFKSTVNFPFYGNWDINIKVVQGGYDIFFIKRVFVEKGGSK